MKPWQSNLIIGEYFDKTKGEYKKPWAHKFKVRKHRSTYYEHNYKTLEQASKEICIQFKQGRRL